MNARNARFNSADEERVGDHRTPHQRDRDRLLYSSAFRRLAEVTQVVTASSGYVFHNRLTHSLQVAQVGRRMAEMLLTAEKYKVHDLRGYICPDVLEAACLAHDLGHPPFGHVIEKELDDLSSDIGGFEGNAQSFRIVCKLAFQDPQYDGLDLTRATLSAILKYPWLRNANPRKLRKWGAYDSEKPEFTFARRYEQKELQPSPEAYLMDWSDDITYSVHDLEDFYRAGRVPLALLTKQTNDKERRRFFEAAFKRQEMIGNSDALSRWNEYEQAFEDITASFNSDGEYRGTKKQRSQLRNFTAFLIGRFINGIELVEEGGRIVPTVAQKYRDEVFMLKELTWAYVIDGPALASQQLGQVRMINLLFKEYASAALSTEKWKLFPAIYQERLSTTSTDSEKKRICIDLIASMTENQVSRIYARLMGLSPDSSLYDPLR